jgi:apolipoprotein D and lipocalin family protein
LIWEKACASARADYSVDEKTGFLNITNVCLDMFGKELFQRSGVATFAQQNRQGKLRLRFTDGLPSDGKSDYWVLLTDYKSYACVGNADKSQLWILSRTPSMSQCLFDAIKRALSARFGYDVAKLDTHKNAIARC